MSRSPRTRRSRDARRREILDATISLAAEHGLGSLTVGRLARELQWSAGALYRHFPSKDALLAATLAEILDRLEPELVRGAERAARGSDRPELAALAGMFAAYARLGMEEPGHFAVIDRMVGDRQRYLPGAEGERAQVRVYQLLGAIAERIAAASAAGELRPGKPELRTATAWAAFTGVLRMGKMAERSQGRLELAQLVQELARTVLIGWGASPAAAESAWRAALAATQEPS